MVADVCNIHRRLARDQAQRREQREIVGGHVERAHRLGQVEVGDRLLDNPAQALGILVAGARSLLGAMQPLFGGLQICQREFGLDHLDIRNRVDLACHVDDVVILEAAHHVDDRVGFANVREKLVAQALALTGTRHQPGDVDELDRGMLHALRVDDLGELLKTGIGNLDHAHIGLDRAERIVFGGDARLGEGVKQRRLADVGQADDATLQSHESPGEAFE